MSSRQADGAAMSPRRASRTIGSTVLVVGALAALALAHNSLGASSPVARPALSPASAGRFLVAEVEKKVRGDWEEAWKTLYPAHQRVASRDEFVRCERATPFPPAEFESMRVLRVESASVHVPGRRRVVKGVAVTVLVTLRWYGPRDPILFRHVFHVVPAARGWSWLLSAQRYRLYEHHACPGHPEHGPTAVV